MATMTIRSGRPLKGRLRTPGDKSISNRAIILSSLAEGDTRVTGFLDADDTQATLRCMRALGVAIDQPSPTELIVHGKGLYTLNEPSAPLDCSSSGTTMRLIAGLLAGQPFLSILTGSEQLLRRPMERISEPLRQMGATVLGRMNNRLPPLAIRGGNLTAIDYNMPVASAQVKTAILLAGLFARGSTVIREPAPLRDHTERMLAAMGADIYCAGPVIELDPSTYLQSPGEISVPGDISSAAFFLVAASVVPDADVTLECVGINPTRNGLLETLTNMGASVTVEHEREETGEPVADLHVCATPSEMEAASIAGKLVPRMIDELPVLAIAATQASGTTTVREAGELRVKESDRIGSLVKELRKMGALIEEANDGFTIHGPTRLKGTVVDSHNDHRLAMTLAVAGLIAEGETTITTAEVIAKSYPEFVAGLRQLGAEVALA